MLTLFAAAECGDAKQVDELLSHLPRKSCSTTDHRRRTALHLAVEHGHEEVVDVVLDHGGIPLDATDCAGFTALHLAAELGHEKIVALLLGEQPDLVEAKAYNDLTCLHLAVIRGHVTIVKQLLETGFATSLMGFKSANKTALNFAVESDHEEIVALLVEAAQSTRGKDYRYAMEMFHNAVASGYGDIVNQLLAQRPALIDTKDYDCKSALQLAAENGHRAIVYELLAAKPDLTEVGGTYKKSLLHFAAQFGYAEVVDRLIIQKPHLIDETYDLGATVLHVAAAHGHNKVIARLLAVKPALASATDMCREIPLHYAAKNGHVESVTQLLAHNPELIDVQDAKGHPPLDLAIFECHHSAAACLITHGATAGIDEGLLWQVIDDAKDEASDEVLTLMLDRQPELIRSISCDTTVLHWVFDVRKESRDWFSDAFTLKCWQMNPEAVRSPDNEGITPFEIAILVNNVFALEMVQGKMSLDETVRSFTKFDEECPQSILDQLRECLLSSLNTDVVTVVVDYFVAKPRKNKRRRDSS